MKSDDIKPFEIRTNAEWRELGVTAENWRPRILRPAAVPDNIRDLVPLAQKWGVTCDVTRHDMAEKAGEAELKAFAAALKGRHADIVDFLYSTKDVSNEQAAFQAMLVLELEECNGPGIPGLLTWAIRKYRDQPTAERRSRLAEAHQQMSRFGFAHLQRELDEAKQLLGN